MKSRFTIHVVASLSDGRFLLTGEVEGVPLSAGRHGSAVLSEGEVVVEIMGVGMVDPILDKVNIRSFLGHVGKFNSCAVFET